ASKISIWDLVEAALRAFPRITLPHCCRGVSNRITRGRQAASAHERKILTSQNVFYDVRQSLRRSLLATYCGLYDHCQKLPGNGASVVRIVPTPSSWQPLFCFVPRRHQGLHRPSERSLSLRGGD